VNLILKNSKRGEVVWARHHQEYTKTNSYFIYTGAKGGIPTLIGKMINKARLWYYDKGMKQKKLPHWKESFRVINAGFDKAGKKYDNIMFRSESSMYYHEIKLKLHELLDAGCETIVLTSPMAIYSHFEEFNSSFYHCFEYIHEWQKEHTGQRNKDYHGSADG